MNEIYFDNAATMKTSLAVANKIFDVLVNHSANPSSFHKLGLFARQLIEEARKKVGMVLNCDPSEVCFTSGGSESNMIALLGSAKPRSKDKKRIVVTAVEHQSVRLCCQKLEAWGYEIKTVNPKDDNLIEQVQALVDENTLLVSVMMVNNETGDLYPIKDLVRVAKRKNPQVLFHCDVAQAFGKILCDVKELNVDLLTFSGHKVGAPSGIGGLYLRRGVKSCLVPGGAQEFGIRMGTENLAAIAGLGVACEHLTDKNLLVNYKKIGELRAVLMKRLASLEKVLINSRVDSVPYVLNFSVLGVPGQVLLNRLEQDNIFVGLGAAACSRGKASHVLKALGFGEDVTSTALRVSFGWCNELDEVKRFCDVLESAIPELRANSTMGGI
ncbi:MAG: cysteine desulfurase [Oscillospiraceae bacterium]|nr:cysteine desulfurase [Oscillospiraceae bacterium]